MPLPLPSSVTQFCDANGEPYAGGFVFTLIPGTETYKNTWQDQNGTSLNTNPIVLDAAGRCTIFGSGDYQLVLFDSANNLIFSEWTSSTISDAMLPVVTAPTIADAQSLLGIVDPTASIDSLQSQLTAEVSRAEGAENTLTSNLNAEIARAEAAEANLQSQISGIGGTGGVRAGMSTVPSTTAAITATFDPPFAHGLLFFTVIGATMNGGLTTGPQFAPGVSNNSIISILESDTSHVKADTGYPDGSGGYTPWPAGTPVWWWAIGY